MQNRYFDVKWSAPTQIKTIITTKNGGAKDSYFGSFNLALHVGADKSIVEYNRKLLLNDLPSTPVWLNQTHTDMILDLDNMPEILAPSYDAAFTRQINKVCAVMTADCLPIFLTDTDGSFVAAIHAGWRGLHNDIIKKTIIATNIKKDKLIAYIGPAICREHFEVGHDVFNLFVQKDKQNINFFHKKNQQKYLGDLPAIARYQLELSGLLTAQVYDSQECTYSNDKTFYSYRKDNQTGRFASLIWIEK